ncbi:MAG TPA: DUF945 family protein [Gammaproteobacteria bacterium]|nr:DUF945 family protein [Gammaproteobacteria bacterium]
MIRRIFASVGILIALLIIAVVVLPYFVGLRAEQGFEYQVRRFNASHAIFRLRVDAYHRGFYSSDADVTLRGTTKQSSRFFGALFGTGAKAQFHIRINHGPIPFAAFGAEHVNFLPVLYTAEFRGRNLPPLSFLGALKPDVYLVQYFGGATRAHIAVPSGRFGLGAAGARWDGGEATIRVDSAHDRSEYRGTIAPIEFQYMDTSLGVTYDTQVQPIEFSGTRSKAKHDLWVGTGSASFAGLSVSSEDGELVRLAGAKTSSAIRESADGRWIGGHVRLDQDGGVIRGWRFSRFSVEGSVLRLDAAALDRGLRALRQQSTRVAKQLTASRARVVAGNALAPAITTATRAEVAATLAAASGSAKFAAHLGFTRASATSVGIPGASLRRLAVGEGSLDFDRKLANDFATKVLGPAFAMLIEQSLQGLVRQGYLTVNAAGACHALLGYRAGVLTVNGRSVSGVTQAPAARTAQRAGGGRLRAMRGAEGSPIP